MTKLGAIVSRYEAMDNANWYYFADRSPFLGWSLRYEVVLALGLVGLWMPGKRDDDRVLRYFLLAAVASLMYATVIGRFRLVPAGVLLVYAGGAAVWIARQVAARRWASAAGTGAAVVALVALSANTLGEVETRYRYRAAEFFLAANGVSGLLIEGVTEFQPAKVLAVTVLVSALAMVLVGVGELVERLLVPWRRTTDG